MSEWNVPIDVEHQIAMTLLQGVRTKLLNAHRPAWEPAPMPADYHPSPTDCLHPEAYDTPYVTIARLPLQPNHHGDEVFFYDYRLGGRHRSTTGLYP
jgi:hypothetical protein